MMYVGIEPPMVDGGLRRWFYPTRRRRATLPGLPRLGTVLLAATAWSLVPASAAAGATITVAKPCYPERSSELSFTGEGFEPGRRYSLRMDGHLVRSGTVGPAGAVAGSGLRVPPARGRARPVRVSLSDGRRTALVVIRTTPFSAKLVFLGGLQVRMHVQGFGPNRAVFLHYVSPSRVAAKTLALGVTTGMCGELLGPPQPIFPFVPGRGNWVLQVDGHSPYSPRAPAPVVRIQMLVLED